MKRTAYRRWPPCRRSITIYGIDRRIQTIYQLRELATERFAETPRRFGGIASAIDE